MCKLPSAYAVAVSMKRTTFTSRALENEHCLCRVADARVANSQKRCSASSPCRGEGFWLERGREAGKGQSAAAQVAQKQGQAAYIQQRLIAAIALHTYKTRETRQKETESYQCALFFSRADRDLGARFCEVSP